MAALRKAFGRSHTESDPAFRDFQEQNAEWLPDYSLFMAVKDAFGGVSWDRWDEDIRLRKPETVQNYRSKYKEEILFFLKSSH